MTPYASIRRSCVLFVLAMIGIVKPAAASLDPTSPEVRAAVDRGIKFLRGGEESEPGPNALLGLTFLKAGVNRDDRVVVNAINECRKLAQKARRRNDVPGTSLTSNDDNIVYTLALSIVFLMEHGIEENRADIQTLLNLLLSIQKPHGGWGYLTQQRGDTSMTQYAVLALWETSRAGFAVSAQSWSKVADWLVRTQDPSGVYGYQGTVASGNELVPQRETRESMTMAGLGSVYICLDAARQFSGPSADDAIPQAFSQKKKVSLRLSLPVAALQAAAERGDRYWSTHYSVEPQGLQWPTYFLFAMERYESFREFMRGEPNTKVDWYDEGAQHLIKLQSPEGVLSRNVNAYFGTSFSILFLVRSTQREIAKAPTLLGGGTLRGGRGLPGEEGPIVVRRGKVIAKPLTGPGEKLLEQLERPGAATFDSALQGARDFIDSADEATLSKHSIRFRQLARQENPDIRAAAIRALGRTRNLDQVPLLITAYDDPDTRVVLAADEALRYIRRQIGGPALLSGFDETQRQRAIVRARNWYLTIRPEAASEFDR